MGKWISAKRFRWVVGTVVLVSTAFVLTAIAATANVTRGPYLQLGTASSMIVRWRTDTSTDSVVRYGPSPASLTQVASVSGSGTEHEVTLTALSPATRYYYSVGSSTETLTGGDAATYFETSPPAGTSAPTRVWVIGDSGTADANAAAVYDAYTNATGGAYTDLWLMLGDNAYDSGTDSEYQAAVFDMYPELLRTTPLWPTLGNHDAATADSGTQSGPYYDIFTLPANGQGGGVASGTEAYYSFDHANVHFVVLDSQDSNRAVGGAMLSWLETDLQSTNQTWLVAFWHHPPYSKGSHDSDTEARLIDMRQNALPILENYGVDLVLAGHSHSYERSYLIDGHYGSSSTFSSVYLKNGGDGRPGGNGAYQKPAALSSHEGAVYAVAGSSGKISGGALNHPAMFVSLNQLGSMVLDFDGDQLDVEFLNGSGSVADSFSIQKASACVITEDPELSCGDAEDNDCDGLVDSDDPDCCPDADGDGYTSDVCGGADCNDADGNVSPLGTEICDDGVDNDCNGLSDCEEPSCALEVVCGGVGEPRTVTITDLQDAYVREDIPGGNYGSETALEIDTASIRKHAFIKPNDLADIGAGAQVVSAYLVLTQFDPGNDVELRRVAADWSEGSITFDTQPATSGTLTTFAGGSTGEVVIDVTSLVQDWVSGDPLYGVQLYPTGSNGVDYRSSEYGTAAERPRFVIEVYDTVCADDDADGYSAEACGGSDCNDANSGISPGAAESCVDGVDNDCDGDVDCADAECGADPACLVCTVTESPEASCSDGVDNDCDEATDCADVDCSSDPACCPDADGDGFSDAACGGSDCNDGDATVYPGAWEVCDDGQDNDCNADIDCFDALCVEDPACVVGGQRTVVITDVDDTFVRSNRANFNYGNASSLQVDTNRPREHAFVQPNTLADIAPGAEVVAAYLVLQQYDPGSPVEIRPIVGTWTEGSVTYNSQPATGATLTTASASTNGEVWIEITTLAQDWVDGIIGLNGVQLYPTGGNGVNYRSSEYGTSSARPRFEIEVIE